jgi:hypothetical protein
VDWLADAYTLNKDAAFILRAEVILLSGNSLYNRQCEIMSPKVPTLGKFIFKKFVFDPHICMEAD